MEIYIETDKGPIKMDKADLPEGEYFNKFLRV